MTLLEKHWGGSETWRVATLVYNRILETNITLEA